MTEILGSTNLAPDVFLLLVTTSVIGSFLTVTLGIGGGVFVLAVMANLIPASVLIPVHGVVQLGSNSYRSLLFRRNISWCVVPGFLVGSGIGIGLGGLLVTEIPPSIIQLCVGLFVLWNLFVKAPVWLGRSVTAIGGISSFLTMFIGATGIFVGNFVRSLDLSKEAHTATHATLMTIQHMLKVSMFAAIGFHFSPWLPLIGAMLLAGAFGTFIGKSVLTKMSNFLFSRIFRLTLGAMAARLVYSGFTGMP